MRTSSLSRRRTVGDGGSCSDVEEVFEGELYEIASNYAHIMNVAMEPYFVPETTTLDDQMREFLRIRSHFALVVDEYGSALCTMIRWWWQSGRREHCRERGCESLRHPATCQ